MSYIVTKEFISIFKYFKILLRSVAYFFQVPKRAMINTALGGTCTCSNNDFNDRLETGGWEFKEPRVQITTKTISVAVPADGAGDVDGAGATCNWKMAAATLAASAADCQDKVCLLKACVRKD